MKTVAEILKETQTFAAANVITKDILYVNISEPGQFTSQGDINIWVVELKNLFVDESEPVYQLAPGTTRGSRHCLVENTVSEARFYSHKYGNELTGPVFVNKRETLISHPEHKWKRLPVLREGLAYAVTYQRRHADEVRRAQD